MWGFKKKMNEKCRSTVQTPSKPSTYAAASSAAVAVAAAVAAVAVAQRQWQGRWLEDSCAEFGQPPGGVSQVTWGRLLPCLVPLIITPGHWA